MEQIIINDIYTKAQHNQIDKINLLFGKRFSQSSLVAELNKIFKPNWIAFKVENGVVIKANGHGLEHQLRFENVNKSKNCYKLFIFETKLMEKTATTLVI